MPARPTVARGRDPRRGDPGEPQQPSGLLDVPPAAADRAAGDGQRRRQRGRRRRRGSGTPDGCRSSRSTAAPAASAGRVAPQRLGEQRQADQPGHEPDGHRQYVDRRRAGWSSDGDARDQRQHARRRAPAPTRCDAPAARRTRRAPAVTTRITATRNGLSRWPSTWIARSASGPGREPDDQLGDRHDRRLPDGHRHRDEVARRQPGEAGHQARERPGAAEGPHDSIVAQA